MKIGIYLGDIKKPYSIGDLTFELSFLDELKIHATNHDFIVYYFGKKNIFKDTQNIKFKCLKYYEKIKIDIKPFYLEKYKVPISSLNHELKKDKVNVVYFLTPYLHEHIEIPYFATIRDVSHRVLPHFPEYSSNRVVEKMERKLNIFLTSASKIITYSNVAKNDIKTLYNIIDENIITLNLPCPNWVKTTKINKNILTKNNLIKNNYILYPAQFWTHKNHIRLILVAQILKEANINIDIVFTGLDKGNKNYLIQNIKELDLEKEIKILDYIEQEDLANLYQNAYAVCYPSLAGPDCICALEAIYYSCPVLISDYSGYSQQLKKAALYFNPLDERDIYTKIRELNNPIVREELICNGKNLIKEHTCKKYVDKFLGLMDNFYSTRRCWSLDENYMNK